MRKKPMTEQQKKVIATIISCKRKSQAKEPWDVFGIKAANLMKTFIQLRRRGCRIKVIDKKGRNYELEEDL